MPATNPLSAAKPSLSILIKDNGEIGSGYVDSTHEKPTPMIVPTPKPKQISLNAFGVLSGKRPIATHEEEKASWAEAMEAKHA